MIVDLQALLISINLEEVLTNAELSNQDYMSALSEEIKGKLGDDNFEKSFELELSEGKNFISFIQKAFDWSENRIDQIEDESHKEQAKQEFLIEKKIWTDFERHLSYNYDLDEITVATYMQEFAMISKESEPAKDAVQFLTIHASKGKEFDHVILIGMVNDELPSFQSMKKGIDTKDADIAKVMGFESKDEYNEIMFLREITHTVNAFNDMADVVRLYSKKPEAAEQRLANLLSEVMYEDSESV